MANEVTDPKLLAELNGGPKEVTDPAVLAALNGTSASAKPGIVEDMAKSLPGDVVSAGSMIAGLPGDMANLWNQGIGKIVDRGVLGAIHKTEDWTGYGPQSGTPERARADEAWLGLSPDKFQSELPSSSGINNAVQSQTGPLPTPQRMPGQFLRTGIEFAPAAFGGEASLAQRLMRVAVPAATSETAGQLTQGTPYEPFARVAGGVAGGLGVGALDGVGANSVEGMSRGAAKQILPAMEADGPATVKANLAALGPDAMLSDAGPALLGKAQGASLNSDEGRSVLNTALTARNNSTNQRIQGDVNQALGPAEDPQTVTNAIKAYRTDVDNKAYTAALDNAPDVKTAPILQQLNAMIPRSVGNEKKALTNLRDMMMTTEKRPVLDAQGFPQYDTMGRQKWQDVPVSQNDASVLHKVKQELDNVIQYDQPGLGVPAGALTRQQGTLKLMRGQLNNALETQVPGYRAANAQSAALAKRADAVEAGTQYLGSGKTTPSPDRFAAEFDPLAQGEKIAFAKGSRGNIERVLGAKANDLQALRGELQGEGGWNTAKLATVHGQDAAAALTGTVDRNLKFRDTYNKVVENSQTAQRQAAAKAMKPDESVQPSFFNPNSTILGNSTAAAKLAFNAALNKMRPDPTRSFGEVARVLSAQGAQRDSYHRALVDALNRRTAGKLKDPRAQAFLSALLAVQSQGNNQIGALQQNNGR